MNNYKLIESQLSCKFKTYIWVQTSFSLFDVNTSVSSNFDEL